MQPDPALAGHHVIVDLPDAFQVAREVGIAQGAEGLLDAVVVRLGVAQQRDLGIVRQLVHRGDLLVDGFQRHHSLAAISRVDQQQVVEDDARRLRWPYQDQHRRPGLEMRPRVARHAVGCQPFVVAWPVGFAEQRRQQRLLAYHGAAELAHGLLVVDQFHRKALRPLECALHRRGEPGHPFVIMMEGAEEIAGCDTLAFDAPQQTLAVDGVVCGRMHHCRAQRQEKQAERCCQRAQGGHS